MSEREQQSPEDQAARQAVQAALRLVCVSLPHLAGLAHAARVRLDPRVTTASVFESGRILVNPEWLQGLERADAAFVIAHELLHLALQTHRRGQEADPRLVNIAHDYVINDILTEALQRPVPASGLEWRGARHRSLESVVKELQEYAHAGINIIWKAAGAGESSLPGRGPGPSNPAMAEALRAAGLAGEETPAEPEYEGDILSGEKEREWFPELDPVRQEEASQAVRHAAAKAASLERLQEGMDRLLGGPGTPGSGAGGCVVTSQALRSLYRPPWEMALQRWMEAVAPGPRSYARPSRRGADRQDLVLAGRKREGWRLNIVLDTSGSMGGQFPRILGAIAAFCESVSVAQVRVLQCDVKVSSDEVVTPEELQTVEIAGLGGTRLTPAILRLAEDPEVEAVIVITDGYLGRLGYPRETMPYAVLWAVTDPDSEFDPEYGQVIYLPGPPTDPDL